MNPLTLDIPFGQKIRGHHDDIKQIK